VQKLLAKISDLETSLKSKSEEAVTVRGECDELRQRHAEALQNVASRNELQVTNVIEPSLTVTMGCKSYVFVSSFVRLILFPKWAVLSAVDLLIKVGCLKI